MATTYAYQRGDIIRRRNLVSGETQTGVVTAVDGDVVTARFLITGEHTMVRTMHTDHVGEPVTAMAMTSASVTRDVEIIVAAERAALGLPHLTDKDLFMNALGALLASTMRSEFDDDDCENAR